MVYAVEIYDSRREDRIDSRSESNICNWSDV